jgi:uncharacterized protein YdeI (YjbR/CyaY-like superfamily)
MKEIMHKDLPVVSFKNSTEFEVWLSQNSTQTTGFWLRFYKKNSGVETIKYPECVDVALCWGWIDGLTNKYDEKSWVIRYTPRGKKSIWSQVNVAKVERLIAENRMQPSGLVHVDAAKADGRWDKAYHGQSTMEVPPDFLIELAKFPEKHVIFEGYTKSQKYPVGFSLSQISDPVKRQNKIKNLIEKIA